MQITKMKSAFATIVEVLQANYEQSVIFQLQQRSWQRQGAVLPSSGGFTSVLQYFMRWEQVLQ